MGHQGETGQYYTLGTICAKLGHELVDLLKMDIERHEFAVIATLTDANAPLQIAFETHLHNAYGMWGKPVQEREWVEMWTTLSELGFRIFSHEPNFLCLCCCEFSITRAALPAFSPSGSVRRALLTTKKKKSAPNTIVTAYFKIPSKHSQKEYDAWMANMLLLQDPMVIYTTEDLVLKIERLRTHAMDRTLVVPMKLEDTWIARNQSTDYWVAQLLRDPEKAIHRSYQLFWIWLSKSWFVNDAIGRNPFNSEVFVWSDIGSFRTTEYNGKEMVNHPEIVPRTAILIMSSRIPVMTKRWPVKGKDPVWVAGAHMAGRIDTWLQFHDAFCRTTIGYIERKLFVGEDQAIIQATCQQHASLCAVIRPDMVKGNVWFGLQYAFHFGGIGNVAAGKSARLTTARLTCLNADFRPVNPISVWTMLTDGADYVSGAVKLGMSVRRHSSMPLDLVVLELKGNPLANNEWTRLRAAGWQRCVVERIAPLDEQGTFGRFRDQFTKLHAWSMTMYKSLLYLDSDTFVLRSIDDLLQTNLGNKQIGVARDYGAGKWRPTFNMGVFLIHPNAGEHERLLKLQMSGTIQFKTTMAEQGFLNEVYKNQWYDIGFEHNANLAIFSQDRSYWDKHESDIRIVHYTMNKPWRCSREYRRPCSWWE